MIPQYKYSFSVLFFKISQHSSTINYKFLKLLIYNISLYIYQEILIHNNTKFFKQLFFV